MDYCTTSIFALKLILLIKCFKGIIRKIYRELRAICIVRFFFSTSMNNVRKTFNILFGKTGCGSERAKLL